MPPVACTNPWLEHGRSSDYMTHQFQARAFRWAQPGEYHDGRICLYAGIQHLDAKCSGSAFVPYPDFVRHLAVLNQTGSASAAAAQVDTTLGFETALLPALDSTEAMESGTVSQEVRGIFQSKAAASKNATAVKAASQAYLALLQAADAMQDRGTHLLPVLFFGQTGDSRDAAALALTQHLWPFYKVLAAGATPSLQHA